MLKRIGLAYGCFYWKAELVPILIVFQVLHVLQVLQVLQVAVVVETEAAEIVKVDDPVSHNMHIN